VNEWVRCEIYESLSSKPKTVVCVGNVVKDTIISERTEETLDADADIDY